MGVGYCHVTIRRGGAGFGYCLVVGVGYCHVTIRRGGAGFGYCLVDGGGGWILSCND